MKAGQNNKYVQVWYQDKSYSYGLGVPLVLGRLAADTFLFFSESESESLSSLESSVSSLVLVFAFFAGSSFELLA